MKDTEAGDSEGVWSVCGCAGKCDNVTSPCHVCSPPHTHRLERPLWTLPEKKASTSCKLKMLSLPMRCPGARVRGWCDEVWRRCRMESEPTSSHGHTYTYTHHHRARTHTYDHTHPRRHVGNGAGCCSLAPTSSKTKSPFGRSVPHHATLHYTKRHHTTQRHTKPHHT